MDGESTKTWNILCVSDFTHGNLGAAFAFSLRFKARSYSILQPSSCKTDALGSILNAKTVVVSEAPCQQCQAWTCLLPGVVLSTPQNNGEPRQHIPTAQHPPPLLPPVLLHQPSHPSPPSICSTGQRCPEQVLHPQGWNKPLSREPWPIWSSALQMHKNLFKSSPKFKVRACLRRTLCDAFPS